MQFWRTLDSKVYPIKEVDQLGFSIEDAYYIPDEYLEQKDFIILRTCFGVGDWGIISAMPRKLKEKYPDCNIWIPSSNLLREMFGQYQKNWSSWEDPFKVVNTIFDNNPYVSGFIDSFSGEAFNDHYRVYTKEEKEPLLEQILRFWQFDDFSDIEPELYWSEEEKQFGDEIIKQHCGDSKFGTLLLSNRFEENQEDLDKIQSILDNNLPIFYWIKNQELESKLKFNKCLDLHHINTRIQLYIKSKATFNVGNQSGMNDTIAQYTTTYSIPRGKLGSNYIRSQIYI